jgi:pimeloyl-ACP methyl ester carboxylesterase
MKLFYFLLLLFIGSNIFSQNEIPLKEKKNAANNAFVFAKRDATLEYLTAPDSAGMRSPMKMPVDPDSKTAPIIPYPIILIHGLISSATTWSTFTTDLDNKFGFTYGGRLDYCLNFDRNDSTANTLFGTLPGVGEDIGAFSSTLIPGDYYCVNFDVGYDGSVHPDGNVYDVRSNQSAIAKQGMAIKWAIKAVLEATGRDKVILMGHSMGGLAARAYLQNPDLWQAGGNHHVAKLVTTGTPHGGSNTSAFGFPIGGLSEQSEAIRDLRASYYYSTDKGIYLWGGVEIQNATHMNDGYGFYNVDVNCNGVINEQIVGLNEKNIPSDADYACIIGKCTGCLIATEAGDGVVPAANADLKLIYTTAAIHQFYYTAYAATEIHTALPGQTFQNMQGLDEPSEFNLAYTVALETTYTGFTTIQPVGGKALDEDHYQFKINQPGTLSVKVNKTDLTDLTADVYDASYSNVCATVHSPGSTTINFSLPVIPGNYYLVLSNTATNTSYLHPYNFILNSTTTAGIGENQIKNTVLCPNPVSTVLNLYIKKQYGNESFVILNNMGQEVMKVPYSTSIDVSKLAKGIYFLKLKELEGMEVIRFVKE